MTGRRPAVVIGITGASGAAIGVRALQLLREHGSYEVHLVITSPGAVTIGQETDLSVREVEALADVVHKNKHIGASIASGSMPVACMLVAPCSIRALSAVAYGITDDLVTRAADVCLKEGRPLLLLVRENPVHAGHLAAMKAVAELGGIIAFPVPAFYNRPRTVDEIVDEIARRALSRLGIPGVARAPWPGLPADVFAERD